MKLIFDKIKDNSNLLVDSILESPSFDKEEMVLKIETWFKSTILDIYGNSKFELEKERVNLVNELANEPNNFKRLNIQKNLSKIKYELSNINIVYNYVYRYNLFDELKFLIKDKYGVEEMMELGDKAQKIYSERIKNIKFYLKTFFHSKNKNMPLNKERRF